MQDGRKTPRMRPHDEDDDWDWRTSQNQIKKDLEEEKKIKEEVADHVEKVKTKEEEDASKEKSV